MDPVPPVDMFSTTNRIRMGEVVSLEERPGSSAKSFEMGIVSTLRVFWASISE